MELRRITPENYRAVLALTVAPDQRDFVAPNVNSLAETYVYPASEARALYEGDEVVGFVLFHPVDVERPAAGHGIVRFMIDHRYQGRGLGRAALGAVVDFAFGQYDVDTLRLSVVPANDRARRLYTGAGFVENGEVDHGETVMVLRRADTT